MNVVGKVGSLISQGVYSVATPFHPFGGAVDVIVVQQQDGTFRSTPWYVRFGKFQGVLKGAEKVVRISVNGVESNFHMYLDNSGEAYFVKEVDEDKGVDLDQDSSNKNDTSFLTNGHRLDHSISDSGVLRLKDEVELSVVPRIQRTESEVRYYDFQDSFDDSVDLPEYRSNSYGNIEGENPADSQGSHPEMVLVSVDGHILTAPISESEQNDENVRLRNPQFHLGPAEETDICEGNGEFSSGENAWAADYISQLDVSTTDIKPRRCDANGDDNTSMIPLKVCQEEEVSICEPQETMEVEIHEDLHTKTDSEGVVVSGIKKECVFKSCLELQELAQLAGNPELQGSLLEVQNSSYESNASSPVQSTNIDELSSTSTPTSSGCHKSPKSESGLQEVEKDASTEVEAETAYDSPSITGDTERSSEQVDMPVSNGRVDDSHQTTSLEDVSNASEVLEPHTETSSNTNEVLEPHTETSSNANEVLEPQTETSSKGDQIHSGLGMGLVAAAGVFEEHRISAEDFANSAPSIIKNQNLVIKFKEMYLTWEKAAPLVLGAAAFGSILPVESKNAFPVEQDDALKSREDDQQSPSSGRRWRLWPNPFRRVKTLEHSYSDASNEDVFLDSESGTLLEPTPSLSNQGSPHKQFVRTNVPTNEQIASLNLKDGQNTVTFSFSTRVLGTQQVDAHIYLWKWNARIVISDVDGTITKSDVLGQFMPLVGKDWTQSGVARLFSAIKENGYQLLFLSARAIVQAYLTRNFLLNLKQDGKTLPNGPVVISPDGLFPSLFREVIRRAPHEFKIACLEDIKRLFPSDYNPFYAGFGNRDTDELSYRKIGIPKGKIFIINPKGEVAISQRIGAKSYTSLHTLVNDMFPPTSLVEQEDYNAWNYWRMPLPDID
ncbi:unnamed protein product [Trifolium pratense]|uniref:Uncharacterized protein n=1 Tax=Trifolium pratense TaxID=57577 RepID=A0ACB0KL21_TRIPR|nr:unnamed protein product [Trifolium pratense]